MINAILENIQEFTESNGAKMYRGVVTHLEEKLYLLESLLAYFDKNQAKHFYMIAERLLVVKVVDKNLSYNCKSSHILILYLLIEIDNKFSEHSLDIYNTKEKYYNLINLLMDKVDEIFHVEIILQTKLYNKLQVIDVIAESNMIKLLHNHKIISVITDFWRGPYERESFIASSYCYKSISKAFSREHSFFGYHYEADTAFSWWSHLKNFKIQWDKPTKAHIFQYKVWEASMDTKYLINGISIVVIGLSLLFYNNKINDLIIEEIKHGTEYYTLAYMIQNGLYTGSDPSGDLKTAEQQYLQDSRDILSGFEVIMWWHFIMSTYFIQNILQCMFAYLRSKSVWIVIPEL